MHVCTLIHVRVCSERSPYHVFVMCSVPRRNQLRLVSKAFWFCLLSFQKADVDTRPHGRTSGKLLNAGPKDHINTRISHSGSKARCERYTRNHAYQDPYVHVVFGGPTKAMNVEDDLDLLHTLKQLKYFWNLPQSSPACSCPKVPRTHVLRVLGPETMLRRVCWAMLSLRLTASLAARITL